MYVEVTMPTRIRVHMFLVLTNDLPHRKINSQNGILKPADNQSVVIAGLLPCERPAITEYLEPLVKGRL